MASWEKYANGIAWAIAIAAVAVVLAYWPTVSWAVKNRKTIDQAIATADGLKQAGVL